MSALRWIDGARWARMIAWLSLDAVRPRWAGLGVPYQLAARQGALIGLLRRQLALAARARSSGPDPARHLVGEVLGATEAELGAAEAEALLRFSRFTFATAPADHPELSAWTALLDRCEADPPALAALTPHVDLRAHLRDAARRAKASRAQAPLLLPLSGWDLGLLSIRGVDDADPGAQDHPVRLAGETAKVATARALWRELLPLLDEGGRESLAWNGTRLAWSLALLPQTLSLPDPATLVENTDD